MFLTENEVVYLPKIKEEDMDYEKIVQDLDLQNENSYFNVPLNEGRKRMRLHELSWEEKIQRKKLRNRIAAQASRDRKKAKMDHMEESVKTLKQQNELLFKQMEELKKKNEILIDANAELQRALAQRPYTCSCMKKVTDEKKEIMGRSNEMKEQICVEDEGPSTNFGTESDKDNFMGSLQYFPSLSSDSEMLADLKGDTFLDDLERLASSLLEEVEQHESRRDTESLHKEISGVGKEKCTHDTEVVGKTSEELESSRSQINSKLETQQHRFAFALSTAEKILFVSAEHSYAASESSHFSMPEVTLSNLQSLDCNIPTITISESEKISEIENELKKDIESKIVTSPENNLDAITFPGFYSPRSEASSDQGYESVGSFYESDTSRGDAFNEFNDLWRDTFSELFPELL